MLPRPVTNASYELGFGAFHVILIVYLSGASTDLMLLTVCASVAAVAGSLTYLYVKTTSSEVKSVPSDHLTPCFNFQVMLEKSAAMPPLAVVRSEERRVGKECRAGGWREQ